MKIAVFTPFGSLTRESGIIYLLANYLQDVYPEVVQLRCNGAFSLCDRDAERSWHRSLDSCLACSADQGRLAGWSGIKSTCLSRYLMSRDIDETRRWAVSLEDDRIAEARFREVQLFPLCESSFRARFGTESPDPRNKNHMRIARRFLLSAARMLLAAERFNKKYAPDMTLVPGALDCLTAAFVSRSGSLGYCPTIIRWDLHARATVVVHPRTGEQFSCDLLLDNVTGMRPDPSTWSQELLAIIGEILSFLQLSDTQLALPIAR